MYNSTSFSLYMQNKKSPSPKIRMKVEGTRYEIEI